MTISTLYEIGDTLLIDGVYRKIVSVHCYYSDNCQTERYYLGSDLWKTIKREKQLEKSNEERAEAPWVNKGKWQHGSEIKIKQLSGKVPVYLPRYHAQCSQCKHSFLMLAKGHFKYCPNCGAKMRKEDEE